MMTIILALAPFFGKLSLYLIDLFIKDKAEKEAAQQAVLKRMHDYNASASDSAGLSESYKKLMQDYLESQKPVSTDTKP